MSLHSEVCAAISDGMNPAVVKWVTENPDLTGGMVAQELDKRASIVTAEDSQLSHLRAAVRDVVVQRIESVLETAEARRAFGLPEVKAVLSDYQAATARGREAARLKPADDRYVPAAVVRRVDRLAARLLRFEHERDSFTGMAPSTVTAEIDRVSYHLAYWRGVRAEQLSNGTTMAYSPKVVVDGDHVLHGGQWNPVVRVNAKSVSVVSVLDGNLTDRVIYAEIEGLRTAGGDVVRIVDGAREIDTHVEPASSSPSRFEVAS